jgi:hypothetical protein
MTSDRRSRRAAVSRRARRAARPSLETVERRELLAAGPFGMNVLIDPYSSLVNWLQYQGRWGNAPGQSDTITYDSVGDPNSDAKLIYDYRVNEPWDGPDPNALAPELGGTYNLSFTGRATLGSAGDTQFTVRNQTYDAATNTTTAQIVVPTGQNVHNDDLFVIVFSNTHKTPTSGLNTGISNAKLIRPGYAPNTTQIFTNQFLSSLKPANTLRYLGADNANGQPLYSGNTLVTVDAAQVDRTSTIPWELMVSLANATNTDMWINIPQGATDDYVRALANEIKNGGTYHGVRYPGLKSNLKIYLEYSNEVWGGIPSNEKYQEAAVSNSAANHPLDTFPGNAYVYENPNGTTLPSSDVYTAASRRYLERTYDIYTILESVFGNDPTHSKLRPVLGWQENNPSLY